VETATVHPLDAKRRIGDAWSFSIQRGLGGRGEGDRWSGRIILKYVLKNNTVATGLGLQDCTSCSPCKSLNIGLALFIEGGGGETLARPLRDVQIKGQRLARIFRFKREYHAIEGKLSRRLPRWRGPTSGRSTATSELRRKKGKLKRPYRGENRKPGIGGEHRSNHDRRGEGEAGRTVHQGQMATPPSEKGHGRRMLRFFGGLPGGCGRTAFPANIAHAGSNRILSRTKMPCVPQKKREGVKPGLNR